MLQLFFYIFSFFFLKIFLTSVKKTYFNRNLRKKSLQKLKKKKKKDFFSLKNSPTEKLYDIFQVQIILLSFFFWFEFFEKKIILFGEKRGEPDEGEGDGFLMRKCVFPDKS